jgi:hypothetical protein
MAGYSGRSTVQKLGIKPGFRIFADGLLKDYREIVGDLPTGVVVASRLNAPLDLVHLFATGIAGLQEKLPICRDAIAPGGMIWVSWPKKASRVATDISETVIRHAALPLGLVDTKVCAIDEVWSGLKFVIPKNQRTKTR